MKKFRFGLETVLDYKMQTLENLKIEQAAINRKVVRQENEVVRAHNSLNGYQDAFNQAKGSGALIQNYRLYDMCIERMGEILEEEKQRLEELKEKEAKKTRQVVEAKIDTSKFEKLKDRRLVAYNKEVMRAEERFSEEFVVRSVVQNRSQHRG